MSIKCLMNGLEVNYPCSPVCPLFGDCTAEFNSLKKSRVHTNADRIRSMSDEELAEFMAPKPPHDGVSWCEPIGRVTCGKCSCNECCLEWLQQPAEEVRG